MSPTFPRPATLSRAPPTSLAPALPRFLAHFRACRQDLELREALRSQISLKREADARDPSGHQEPHALRQEPHYALRQEPQDRARAREPDAADFNGRSMRERERGEEESAAAAAPPPALAAPPAAAVHGGDALRGADEGGRGKGKGGREEAGAESPAPSPSEGAGGGGGGSKAEAGGGASRGREEGARAEAKEEEEDVLQVRAALQPLSARCSLSLR
eukprot:141873-Rhodomonas_salina.1